MTLLERLDGALSSALEGSSTDETVDFLDRISDCKLGDNISTERACGTSNNLWKTSVSNPK